MTVTPLEREAADLLDKAGNEIERRGLFKHYFYEGGDKFNDPVDFANCRVCAIGAVRCVITGTPSERVTRGTNPAYDLAGRALLDVVVERGYGDVPDFNDADATTQDDVVALFHDTAAQLRGEAAGQS